MTDSYKKIGRGGAGNFYSEKFVQGIVQRREGSDLEAHPSKDDLARAVSSSQSPPEYLHTGRGGAGNWIQPSELSAQRLAQVASPDATSPASPSNPNISISKRVAGVDKPVYRGGRGGAGNYTVFAEEERLKKEHEERMRRETEERIIRDVESGLARPPKAYGGHGGAWEMAGMN